MGVATAIRRALFPPAEADMIAELVERDLPYYSPVIDEETVAGMVRFSQARGILSEPLPYERVVATQCRSLWR